jgi:hypothetical protein
MSLEHKVHTAIESCAERLEVVQSAIKSEISKPIWQRRMDLLNFLYKEREVYTFALTQLEEIFEEGHATKSISNDF